MKIISELPDTVNEDLISDLNLENIPVIDIVQGNDICRILHRIEGN